MLIFHENGGRFGNQLLQLIHLYASSLEYNTRVYRLDSLPKTDLILTVAPYVLHPSEAKGFSKLVLNLLMTERNGLFKKIIRKLFRFFFVSYHANMNSLPGEHICLVKKESQRRCFAEFRVWPYYHFEAVYKWQDTIRRNIQFSPESNEKATQYLTEIGAQDCTLVGIHLRRTDYKSWLGGRYYYPLSLYIKLIKQTADCIPGKLKFIVFSDENLTPEQLEAEHLDMDFSQNPFMIDYILLSRCDYLIGPPSTFSGTASFLGKAKKFTIWSTNSNIHSINDFGIVGIDYETATALTVRCNPDDTPLRGYIELKEGKIVAIHTPQ